MYFKITQNNTNSEAWLLLLSVQTYKFNSQIKSQFKTPPPVHSKYKSMITLKSPKFYIPKLLMIEDPVKNLSLRALLWSSSCSLYAKTLMLMQSFPLVNLEIILYKDKKKENI